MLSQLVFIVQDSVGKHKYGVMTSNSTQNSQQITEEYANQNQIY